MATASDDQLGFGLEDPYPHYAELRESAPVHSLADGSYVLTRYDDILAAVRNHGTFGSKGALVEGSADASIIGQDPPEHTRFRQLVTGPFRPSAIAALEADLQVVTDVLVDNMISANRRGEADLVRDLAIPLPVIAIANMMGIPSDQHGQFRRWSDLSIAGLAGLDVDADETAQAMAEMAGFFMEIIAQRRVSPGDDLISAVVGGDDPLSEEEVLVFCFTLLVAGNETTTNLIANAMLALLADPAEQERLWAEPALVPEAMEEALRFDPPAQAVRRITKETAVVGDGYEIPEGKFVTLLLAAANRDPRRFDDPDQFDIGRDSRGHLGFGHGVHLCLGASLARLEARLAYETLIGRVSAMRHDGPVTRQLGQLRGVRSMPVSFEEI
jgi:cytochrome P450